MKIYSEHYILIAGLIFMFMGLLWDTFFKVGITMCILSYAVDLLKRTEEIDIEEILK